MYFIELQKRLIAAARQRIRAGLVTERRLARLSGISQPHMHNVLSGIRSVTFDSADKILRGLQLTIPDLLGLAEGNAASAGEAAARSIPVLRAPVGPGRQDSLSVFGGHLPVPAELVKEAVEPVLARLGPDLALPGAFMAGDLVLLDQNPALRSAPQAAGYWVIADGAGLRLCYLRIDKNRVWIGGENISGISDPEDGWRVFETRGRRLEELLKARVVWMAREIMPGPDRPPEPRVPFSPS